MNVVLRALVVDDSRFARKMISVALQNTAVVDWKFDHAATGVEAIRCLELAEYDLVITDVNMPELSGPGLLRYIRKRPKWTDMPVVVVSSVGSGNALPSLIADGATAVIAKPISTPQGMARLTEVITELLG